MSWVDNSFFAPRSLLDDKGRRIMWAWCLDKPGIKMRTDRGWSGTMSLPRVLAPAADGSVTINPPDELERLRYAPRHRDAFDVAADSRVTIDEAAGTSLEIVATFAPPEKGRCGLVVCRSPRGEEETLVFYDADTKQLKIDTTKSSLKDEPKAVEAGPLALPAGEPLRLRVFVDKSIVEVFANGRQAAMRRIYPSLPDATGVQVFSTEGPARVTSFDAWDMMPSNPY